MRLVLDTNTVISALLWKGVPHHLLVSVRVRRDITLHTSVRLLAELADVLARSKLSTAVLATAEQPEALFKRYVGLVRIHAPAVVVPVVAADPDDDHVLACALDARADAIVSGDSHLLRLKAYQGVPILGAAAALRLIAK
jgi:putative PIN family toxin of toxin-antitoxin system